MLQCLVWYAVWEYDSNMACYVHIIACMLSIKRFGLNRIFYIFFSCTFFSVLKLKDPLKDFLTFAFFVCELVVEKKIPFQ